MASLAVVAIVFESSPINHLVYKISLVFLLFGLSSSTSTSVKFTRFPGFRIGSKLYAIP